MTDKIPAHRRSVALRSADTVIIGAETPAAAKPKAAKPAPAIAARPGPSVPTT